MSPDRQLELFSDGELADSLDKKQKQAGEIARYLTSRCGRSVRVVFTDNTSTMITVKRSPAYEARLHHMFAQAPVKVLNALAVYMKWPRHKASNATLSRYMKEHSHLVRKAPAKPVKLKTSGRYFDLNVLYDKVNAEYFNGEITAPITWGRPYRGRRRSTIRFGCVDQETGVIRINPSLDAEFVPEYFVEYIVFHEMLHCVIDMLTSEDGRSLAHHRDFKRREREYSRYQDAVKWQDENLYRFIGRKR
jgi:hypothetical protein